MADMSADQALRETAELLEEAAARRPDFWRRLREEIGRVRLSSGGRQSRATQTAGPIVDVGVQASPATVERAVQTDGPAEEARPVRGAERAVQTDAPAEEARPARGAERAAPTAAPEEEARPGPGPERAASPDLPRASGTSAMARAHSPQWIHSPYPGCWNCEARGHYYSECPRPRNTQRFCFRCGRRGTTLKDCPNCREAWRAEGPRVEGRGRGRSTPSLRGGQLPSLRRSAAGSPP
ncbi:PREDICTED: skin secretory protein xP2-like [Vollenhovia emeryi]|uniref:skin secretory protein xP2-like n=1 Tax=Vollenhovia emeryi TaxID=411798 RepID=UPI0005F3919A|nr:PREDICTED: skin secretory protein xP2-like [Vollenhovia emeryi]